MEQTLEVQATISVLIPEDKILIDKVEYHELKKQDFDGWVGMDVFTEKSNHTHYDFSGFTTSGSSKTAQLFETIATLPAALCPTRTVNKVITTQNTNNNDKPMEIQIQEGGNINIWSMPASTSGRYGGFEESYPLG